MRFSQRQRSAGSLRRRWSVVLAVVLGFGAVNAVTPAAQADGTYCGQRVLGAIEAKYRAMAPNPDRAWESKLGCPISGEKRTADGRGHFTTFAGGSIYWTSATGAHAVWGEIGKKWGQLGWERGDLGYPKDDEFTNPDGQGKRQEYEGGTVYWHPTRSNGAHAVWGEIGKKWGAAGWEGGTYGYPVGDEFRDGLPTSPGTVQQVFENGPILWNSRDAVNNYHSKAAQFLTGQAHDGAQAQTAKLVPAGPDRGIVMIRDFIADGSVFTDVIGEHRQFDANPEAGAKATVAWDTSTGQVGIYVHKSCIRYISAGIPEPTECYDALPLRRTIAARDASDPKDVSENRYWVEPVAGGGIRVDLSLVNGADPYINDFPSWLIPARFEPARIDATFTITPHRGVGERKDYNYSTFDVRATKDKFPSTEILRYPRYAPTPDTYYWLGSSAQTEIGDLKGVRHTCSGSGEGAPGSRRELVCG